MKYAAIAFIIALAVGSPEPRKPTKLTLLYTSSARGQVRSCNCTKFRFGGYGRELTLLTSIRKDSPDVVLLEGGDCVEWTDFQGDLKLEVTKKALKMLGYDAMVPGEDELGRSGHRLIDKFDPKTVPIICANLHSAKDGPLSFQASTVVKTKGGLRVALIGLLDPGIGRAFQQSFVEGIVSDPTTALKSTLAKLHGNCDVTVVIYHGPLDAAEKLGAIKDVDLVIATHRTSRDVILPPKGQNVVEAPVKRVNGTLVVDSGTKTNWSLGRIDMELANGHGITSAKHTLVYLDRTYEEAPEMVEVYEGYNTRVKEAVLERSAKLKSEMQAMLVKRGLNLDAMRSRLHKSPFATDETCKTCHARIHENWSKTRHARAMATLEKTKQEYDPECVSCHATGVLVRNGFDNMKQTPKLANVQCESCHGPGLAHSEKPAKGYGQTGEPTCRSCHTDERTPDFEYEAAWEKVKH